MSCWNLCHVGTRTYDVRPCNDTSIHPYSPSSVGEGFKAGDLEGFGI